uniref:E3 ubiquitin-protein ligase TRIM71-like n=1 Tax=Crassostrea virginica TaxID=6565 RepID=A0A8B8AVR3_CRAVI|nr:E3 ubiquitin-protein ligase TRIM71-like [Crassostrea virginica]
MMATSPESKHEMQVEVNCDTCENTAKHLCKTCHDRLCDGCKIIHSKSKASCDHDVVLLTFEKLTLTSDCSLEYPPYQDCKWHPTFKANVACKKCEVPVCEKCLIGNHNGHSLKDINEMFKDKKEKLEQKVSRFRSELPKYESNLEEVKRNQEKILKNRDAVKKEIVSHYEKVISTLEASKEMLLSSADNMAQTSINALANHHQTLQSYIHNMHKLANNVENEDLRKRKAFIFYENCSAYYLGELLEFLSPGLLKYSETIICKQSEQFLGRVSQNIKLRETKTIEVIRVLSCEEQIGALVYSSKSGAFWLSPVEAKLYYNTKISEEGKCLVIDGIKVKELNSPSKVRCIVVDNDTVVYMKDCHKLFTQEESQKNLLIDFAPMVVVCLSLTKDRTFGYITTSIGKAFRNCSFQSER